jgi:uncharacterized small protein (DUF1192 family)
MDRGGQGGQGIHPPASRNAGYGWEGRETMLNEDDLPTAKPKRMHPPVLDLLGVEELRDYIGELQAEIGRVEADIVNKQAHRSAADAFFRKT